VKILKHTVPLVGPWLAYSAAEWETVLKKDLALMNELVKQLPDLKGDPEGIDPGDLEVDPATRLAGGTTLLRVRELLAQIPAPESEWGLKKKVTPEGHILWLCDHHYQEYAR
jgi:hypothetical protein